MGVGESSPTFCCPMRHNALLQFFTRKEIIVGALVLLATFLRVYRLTDFPPALFLDEAFNATDVLRVLRTPSHPIFFEANTGREPLMIYLEAFGVWLWGVRDWALRIFPAMIGILTVPMLYRLGASLYADESRGKIIGALAAAILAVSFWHLHLSRLLLRVIAYALFSTITVWLFWRAWHSWQMRDFALTGLALGITLYTYLSARALPFVFIAFGLIVILLDIVQHRALFNRRRALLGLAVMLIVASILFIPLGIYFFQHPGSFFLRASYVSIFSGDAQGLASLPYTVTQTIRMFIDQGDTNPTHNLPGLAALNPIAALGFWIGIGLALASFKSKPVYVLLITWLGLNLAPTMLSVDNPHFLRTLGALPPALILAADGLTWLWQRITRRWNPLWLVIGMTVFGGVVTFNDYFNHWGPNPTTYQMFDGARRTILERALTLSQTNVVVIPFDTYSTPSAQFYLANRFGTSRPLDDSTRIDSAIWIGVGGIERTVVILRPDGSALIPQPLDDALVARLNERLGAASAINNPFGQPIATELRLSDAAIFLRTLKPQHPVNADLGGQIRLLGYDLDPARVSPGDQVRVIYYWQALTDVEYDYLVSSTLLDAHSNAFTQRLSEPLSDHAPTSTWRRGAIILDIGEIKIPTTVHPGKYRFELGVINRSDPTPLALANGQDRILLTPITVPREPVNPNGIQNPLAIRLGEPTSITLLGYDLVPARQGAPLLVTLYWRAERAMSADYSVFVHLLDANGNLVAQHDGAPQNGDAPTSWWQPGDLIADPHQVIVPADLAPGQYTLEIGVYDSVNGVRLAVFDVNGKRQMNDAWLLPIDSAGR